MKAAVLHGPRDLRVVEPEFGLHEDIVWPEAIGICSTDVQVYRGAYPARLPLVLGHEYVGVVAAIGAEVTGVSPGDRVTSGASWPCGACPRCRHDAPAESTDRRAGGLGVPPKNTSPLASQAGGLGVSPNFSLALGGVGRGICANLKGRAASAEVPSS